jgi:hypothetical protein
MTRLLQFFRGFNHLYHWRWLLNPILERPMVRREIDPRYSSRLGHCDTQMTLQHVHGRFCPAGVGLALRHCSVVHSASACTIPPV